MALFKSNLLSQASGSMNGVVFSHNRGGQYIRNRSSVTNPGTDRQDVVRTAMTSIAKAWVADLTQDQRDAWKEYGDNTTVTNKLGDPRHLSGMAMFQRVNLFKMTSLGHNMVLDVPNWQAGAGNEVPAFVSIALEDLAGTLTLNLTTTAATTGFGFVVYYSSLLSQGVRYHRGPYSGFLESAGGAGTSVQISMPYDFSPPLGKRAHKVIMFDTTTELPYWTIFTDALPVPVQIP